MSKVILVTGIELVCQSLNVVQYFVCTGGNTGIGYELVSLLAQKGHKVYLGARSETAGKEAAQVAAMSCGCTSPTHITIVRRLRRRISTSHSSASISLISRPSRPQRMRSRRTMESWTFSSTMQVMSDCPCLGTAQSSHDFAIRYSRIRQGSKCHHHRRVHHSSLR